MDTTAPDGIRTKQRLALFSLALCMMLASLGTSIANIALPTIAVGWSVPVHSVQWVVTSYLIALTLMVVVAGRLGDRFGLRPMLLVGLGVFGLASLLCGWAPDLGVLIFARALQGAGAAVLMTLTIALVQETAGADQVGRAMGLLGTMSALGTALGPVLGGFVIAAADWPGVFLILLPLAVIGMALALVALPSGGGAAALPRLQMRDLIQPGLMPKLAANLLVAAVMMATLVVGPFYLAAGLGLGMVAVGSVMSVGPAISIFSGVPAGRLVDRIGAAHVSLIGIAAMAVGALALAFLPGMFGIAGYLIAIAVLTPGYQMFQAANNTAVMQGADRAQRGLLSGLLALSRNLGLILGASGMAVVFAYASQAATADPALSGSIVRGLQVTFGLAALMMVACFALIRPR